MGTRWALDGAALAEGALAVAGIASAAVFVRDGESGSLDLRGAAGIGGPALDGLVQAVTNPDHPIHRAVTDPGPTFDVTPMNPGGPALRSHLPIRGPAGSVAVLAVAHDVPLGTEERRALQAIADEATQT